MLIKLPGFADVIKVENDPPPVHAVQSTTGLGKTSILVEEIAYDRQHPAAVTVQAEVPEAGETYREMYHRPWGFRGAKEMYRRPWGFLVPTHRLGENDANLFQGQGLSACVI